MRDWTEGVRGVEAGMVAPVLLRVSRSAKLPIICITVQMYSKKKKKKHCRHLQARPRTWRQLSPADDSRERWASEKTRTPGPNQHVSGVKGNAFVTHCEGEEGGEESPLVIPGEFGQHAF